MVLSHQQGSIRVEDGFLGYDVLLYPLVLASVLADIHTELVLDLNWPQLLHLHSERLQILPHPLQIVDQPCDVLDEAGLHFAVQSCWPVNVLEYCLDERDQGLIGYPEIEVIELND